MTPCLHSRDGLERVAPCPQCGERKPVSASEVKLARTCWRKWAFRYASQFPKPEETQAQRDGTQLHTLMAAYLTEGVRPDPAAWMGELANAGIDSGLLPAPFTGRTEVPDPLVIDGLPFVVIRDWMHVHEDVAIVLDHKTSSNPTRYAIKSNEERLDDPQHLLYGSGLDALEVHYRWIYYPTKGRGKVTSYDGVLTTREIRGGLERVVLPVAEKAYRIREREIDPNSLDANTGSCMLFNRPCEYTEVCDVNHSATFLTGLAPEKDDTMSSAMPSLFAALPPVNGAPAAPAPSVPTPAQQVPTPFKFEFPSAPTAPVQATITDIAKVVAEVTAPQPPIAPPSVQPAVVSPATMSSANVCATREGAAFSVHVSWNTNGHTRAAQGNGEGATLDDAIKAALAALPR